MLLSSRGRMHCLFCTFAESERLLTPTYRYGYNLNRSYGRPPATIRSFGSAHTNGLRGEFKIRHVEGSPKSSRKQGLARYNSDRDRIRDNVDNRDFRNPSPSRGDRSRSGHVRISRDNSFMAGRGRSDRKESGRETFAKLLHDQLRNMENQLRSTDTERLAWGIKSDDDLKKSLQTFGESIEKCTRKANAGSITREQNPLFFRLRNAFLTGSTTSLANEMKYAMLESVVTSRLPKMDQSHQLRLADLRHPIEWYPATRALHRTIHLHVGPTNSGKTYHALKKLEAAQSGIYAGPLRLLAHEVYTRMNALGKKCALVTGEERRIPDGMTNQMSSCTVEMVPLNTTVDVAVIDEIQMMGDLERGWAWTQAFLGVKAREVHLCGEVRTVELITELCKKLGDKLVIHRYERLSPLETSPQSLNHDLSKLEKGDAIILFSRVAIHAMKAVVEAKTKRRCAVVYGSLPPETRAQQAALFNDPDNDYDYLVASDAVGMGLNLSIKRIIFEAVAKHNGTGYAQIPISEIKQIAGRAGRYKTARDAIVAGTNNDSFPVALDIIKKPDEPTRGFVTTLDKLDLPVVKEAMTTDVEQMKTAGIFPPSDTLVQFASYFPADTPFSYIVVRLHDLAIHESIFQMCRLKEQIQVADLIQPYSLSIQDRLTFMAAPMALREKGFEDVMKEFAQCVADQDGGELLNLKSLNIDLLAWDIHDHRTGTKGYLKEAEFLHKALTLYLWLSYRFSGIFRSQALAFHVKALTEEKIDQCLAEVEWDDESFTKLNAARRQSALQAATQREQAAGELYDGSTGTVSEELEDLEATEEAKVEEATETSDLEDSPASDGNMPTPFNIEDNGEEPESEEIVDLASQVTNTIPESEKESEFTSEPEEKPLSQSEMIGDSNEETQLEEGTILETGQEAETSEHLEDDAQGKIESQDETLPQSETTEDKSEHLQHDSQNEIMSEDETLPQPETTEDKSEHLQDDSQNETVSKDETLPQSETTEDKSEDQASEGGTRTEASESPSPGEDLSEHLDSESKPEVEAPSPSESSEDSEPKKEGGSG